MLRQPKVWSGEYPIFFEESVCLSEEVLVDILCTLEIKPSKDLCIYSAEPIYASDALKKSYLMECVEDEMPMDCEVPESLEELIDEFIEKVSMYETPLGYWEGNLLALTDEQVKSLCVAVQKAEDACATEKRVSDVLL